MTDHEHTTLTEVIREAYIGEPPYTLYEYTEEEFDRWLAERDARIIAAAEQRGAINALRDAAESSDLIDHLYANLPVNQPIAVREASKYLHNRADLLEGDDA